MGQREVELRIAKDYYDEITAIGEQLSTSEGGENKRLQKELNKKMDLYDKQVGGLQEAYPDDEEVLWLASFSPHFKALKELSSEGFMRRVTKGDAGISTKISAGIIAKSQEKKSMKKALDLFNEATEICDLASHRFMKAGLLESMNRREEALAELDYIIENCADEDVYVDARKMKDELESEKKKRCFIATAAYGSPNAMEVDTLRDFRDSVLMNKRLGRLFVRGYYLMSPPFAHFISKRERWRRAVRKAILNPMVSLLRRGRGW